MWFVVIFIALLFMIGVIFVATIQFVFALIILVWTVIAMIVESIIEMIRG